MQELGINQGTSGNVSVRTDTGFLITPSAIAYDTMLPEHIVAIDMDGRTRSDVRPSSEWRLHHAIYHHCTHANAVIHTHSVFCTALACLRRSIPAFHYMVAVAGGTDIRCSDYATFGTQALADNIIAALTDRRACLIANHGMVCYGDDLDRTLSLASEVETLAKQYWHACQLGEPNILSTEEMREVLEAFIDYRN
ncbi:MAG: class II aldolase/adducin family protein [Gammaproteobacteria bacterium]|nr:class II aldolase/adducin family protein [Gammaproteobacteria bacterium]